MSNNIIIIASAVVIFLLIILIIVCIIKKKKSSGKENLASILDVDLKGVPESNDRTFDYGYEKEDTIVMNPVEEVKDDKSNEKEKK